MWRGSPLCQPNRPQFAKLCAGEAEQTLQSCHAFVSRAIKVNTDALRLRRKPVYSTTSAAGGSKFKFRGENSIRAFLLGGWRCCLRNRGQASREPPLKVAEIIDQQNSLDEAQPQTPAAGQAQLKSLVVSSASCAVHENFTGSKPTGCLATPGRPAHQCGVPGKQSWVVECSGGGIASSREALLAMTPCQSNVVDRTTRGGIKSELGSRINGGAWCLRIAISKTRRRRAKADKLGW
jgi:hypothetical protein